jgi:hypothetical protein
MPRLKNSVVNLTNQPILGYNWSISTKPIFDQGNMLVGLFIKILTNNPIDGFGLVLRCDESRSSGRGIASCNYPLVIVGTWSDTPCEKISRPNDRLAYDSGPVVGRVLTTSFHQRPFKLLRN